MKYWSLFGFVALLTFVAASVTLFEVANGRTSWVLAGVIIFVVLWVAGIIAIKLKAYQYDAEKWENVREHLAVRPPYFDVDVMRDSWQHNLVASMTASSYLSFRSEAYIAEPTAALARAAKDLPRPRQKPDPSPVIAESVAAGRFEAASGVAHRDQILRHLIESYLEERQLPSGTPHGISIAQFHRLYRHVVQEGYGE